MSVLDLFFSNAGYNTRVVTTGVTLLGVAAGVVGTFTFLRRRSLLSDALSHATLPGICLAFLLAVALGVPARSLPILLLGAAVSGAMGLLCVQWISHHTRLNEDAAIAIVLSSFFGLGVVLLTVIQIVESGSQAGLDSFIMGQTAAMSAGEAWSIGLLALVAIVVTWFFYKELLLYSFDADFAQGLGWSVARLDLLIASLTVFVTVIGLQAVGLILVVALLIIPPVAARFWTEKLHFMLGLSGFFGGLSAFMGARLSAVYPNLPTGAVIVICAGVLFMVSLLFAPQRGVIASIIRRLTIAIELQSSRFLAELYLAETEARPLRLPELPGWQLGWIERRFSARGWIANGALTQAGKVKAQAIDENLRLWEAYLWASQESFPDKYQWGIDDITVALSSETIAMLRETLERAPREAEVHGD